MKNKTMKILSATVMMAIGTLGSVTVSQAAVDSVIGDTYTIGATTEGTTVTLSAKTGAVSSGNKGLVTGETVSAYLHAEHMALGSGTKADGSAATAYGFSDDASGAGSTAVGFYNQATEESATAVGYYNAASGESSTAVGNYNNYDAENDKFIESGNNSTAVGSWNTTSGEYSTALGLGNTASGEQASAIGAFNTAEGESSSAVGLNNTVSGKASAAFGYSNTVSGDGTYVYGGSNEVAAKGALVLGTNVETVADNSVVIGDGSTSEEENTVSIGSEGNERKLVHVADGTDAHDAATFGQLTNAATELDNRISHVETDANKGIAKATALAALHPLDYDPDNKFDVAAAGGFYKGEKAFALGAFYRPNRNMMVSLATSLSSGDNAYNVGVTFKVGKAGKRAESGVSTAELYAMIGAMQEKMDQQQKRIEELEANQAK